MKRYIIITGEYLNTEAKSKIDELLGVPWSFLRDTKERGDAALFLSRHKDNIVIFYGRVKSELVKRLTDEFPEQVFTFSEGRLI